MLISDIFRSEESQIDSLSADFELRDNDEVDDRKIINFVSAKAELEQESSAHSGCAQSIRAFLNNIRADRAPVVAESVIEIFLILAVLISVLLGLLWGF
jgi:hypothetical protein